MCAHQSRQIPTGPYNQILKIGSQQESQKINTNNLSTDTNGRHSVLRGANHYFFNSILLQVVKGSNPEIQAIAAGLSPSKGIREKEAHILEEKIIGSRASADGEVASADSTDSA